MTPIKLLTTNLSLFGTNKNVSDESETKNIYIYKISYFCKNGNKVGLR